MTRLKLAFMGSPDFSVPTLKALIDAGHEVVCVYAQPPRPAGRGQKERPCPVHAYAEAHGITVRTPRSFRKDEAARQEFAGLDLDAAVVAAYGLILPKEVLDAPKLGCFNVHASLLPRWRGAAPIQRAILAGDDASGITIMCMDEGLDTGAMLLRGTVPITAETTAEILHDALAAIGGSLVTEALDGVANGTLKPTVQPEDGVTYAHKLERDEGRIDWTQSATQLERTVRALNPWPGVWFELAGKRVKVLAAEVANGSGAPGTILDTHLTVACGERTIRPTRVQKAGKAPMDTDAFLRGNAVNRGDVLV